MSGTWQNPFPAVLAAALLFSFSATPAAALDQAALEELETLLHDLGFDPGKVDGVVDDDTIAAIRRYQEFAVLPGEPEPSGKLLDELRGVAAAFAALSAGKEEAAAAPAATVPELGAGPPEATPPAPPPDKAPAAPAAAEKVIVPPPPPPPKLKPEEPQEQSVAEDAAAEPAVNEEEPEPQVAEVPPTDTLDADAPPTDTPGTQPADEAQARIDAELAPYRADLDEGRITRAALAKQFNNEGREALQRADYGVAVLKFSVAIHLDPDFAGAYSNRGTAYQRQDETKLAAADFAKAKELGFGGFRLRDGKSPFN